MKVISTSVLVVFCALGMNALYAQTAAQKGASPQAKTFEERRATQTTTKKTVFESASKSNKENCTSETICSYKYQCPPKTPQSEVERVCTVVESNCRVKTTCN